MARERRPGVENLRGAWGSRQGGGWCKDLAFSSSAKEQQRRDACHYLITKYCMGKGHSGSSLAPMQKEAGITRGYLGQERVLPRKGMMGFVQDVRPTRVSVGPAPIL